MVKVLVSLLPLVRLAVGGGQVVEEEENDPLCLLRSFSDWCSGGLELVVAADVPAADVLNDDDGDEEKDGEGELGECELLWLWE